SRGPPAGPAERQQKPRPVGLRPPPQTPDETLACLPGAPSPSAPNRSTRARFGSVFGARDMAEENAPVEVAAPVAAPTPVLGEPMDLMTALQLVMKKSSAHDGLVKGLREAAKAIEKHAAQICVLAEDCDQPDYVKLVKALCAEHNVHLVTVPSAKTLGEWAGLCKIDSEGKARKVVGCSCVVVKDYGEDSEGLHIVQEYVKSH
uniref:40S ribosomal protein S12 n=6 Tax=Triticinae TaxID=1648030 RepID=A0A453LZW5_AEGTS